MALVSQNYKHSIFILSTQQSQTDAIQYYSSASLGVLAVMESAWRPDWSSSERRSYTIRCRLTRFWPWNLADTIFTLKCVSCAPPSISLTAACPACWWETSSTSKTAACSAVSSFVLILLALEITIRDAIYSSRCHSLQLLYKQGPKPFSKFEAHP